MAKIDPRGNGHLALLLDLLNARGVEHTVLWEANRFGSRREPPDVYFIRLMPAEHEAMRHATAIVIDYGPGNGYGLYAETGGAKVSADVKNLIGPQPELAERDR